MMLRCALLLGCLFSGLAHAAHALDRDPALRISLASWVVKVEVVSPTGRLGLGSGVVVADGKVITNCHVTRNAASIHVGRGEVRYEVAQAASDMPRAPKAIDSCEAAALGMTFGMVIGSVRSRDW